MGKIDIMLAKQMVNNYADKRKRLIDQTYGINDTTSIWFSKDELDAFVAALPDSTTGIRIYLGVCNDDYLSTPDQTTIIAIGTFYNPVGDVDLIGGYEADDAPVAYNTGKLCPPQCTPPPPPPQGN